MQNVDNCPLEMWAAEEAEEAGWTHFQIWATSSRQQPAAGRDIYQEYLHSCSYWPGGGGSLNKPTITHLKNRIL